jgi:hypothetical protein
MTANLCSPQLKNLPKPSCPPNVEEVFPIFLSFSSHSFKAIQSSASPSNTIQQKQPWDNPELVS